MAFDEESFSDLEEELLQESRAAHAASQNKVGITAAAHTSNTQQQQQQQEQQQYQDDLDFEELSDEDLNVTIAHRPAPGAATAPKNDGGQLYEEASGSTSYSEDYEAHAGPQHTAPTAGASAASFASSSRQPTPAHPAPYAGSSTSYSRVAVPPGMPAAAAAAEDSYGTYHSTPSSSSKRSSRHDGHPSTAAAPSTAAVGQHAAGSRRSSNSSAAFGRNPVAGGSSANRVAPSVGQSSQTSIAAGASQQPYGGETKQTAVKVLAATSSCGSSRRSSQYDAAEDTYSADDADTGDAEAFEYENHATATMLHATASPSSCWPADEAAEDAAGECFIDYNNQEMEYTPPTLEEQLQGSVPREFLPPATSKRTSGRTSRSRLTHQSPAFEDKEEEEASSRAGFEGIPVREWDVSMVCDWLASIGMSQYRKKFLHNFITGNLLLRLTEQQLKADVGIGPLGHRVLILDSIKTLQDQQQQQQGEEEEEEAAQAAAVSRATTKRRPASAPTKRATSAPRSRRPSGMISTSGGEGSSGALGPAQGRQTVYEQRAKLMFELNRAQQRAAAVTANASQVSNAAKLAADEVARLQGQLIDLERKNKGALRGTSGTLDSQARIPWQPVGSGTKASDPRPESRGRAWDPPEADFTFQPRISAVSRRIMGGAGGQGPGFLDRLQNDLKHRQGKLKELHRKYSNPEGAAGLAAAAKRTDSDLQVLAAGLGQRWGISLTADKSQTEVLDQELTDIISSYGKELHLTEKQQERLPAAPLGQKVAVLAGAIRTLEFMDRYRNDLSTRGSRQRDLERKWFTQSATAATIATATAKGAKGPPSDAAAAAEWFAQLGWPEGEDEDCEPQLTALLRRAVAYKEAREKLVEKEREKPPELRAPTEPEMDWSKGAWSMDGLTTLMQPLLEKAAAAAAAAAASGGPPGHPKGLGGLVVSNPLEYSVRLLAGCRMEALKGMEEACGMAKKVLVYRNLRTQRFLDFTANDMATRSNKLQETWRQIEASRRGKLVSKEQLDAFYARLQADAAKRKESIDRAKHEAALRQLKELQGSYATTQRKGSTAPVAAGAQ